MNTQRFFEMLGFDSFSALVMEDELQGIELENLNVHFDEEPWSGDADTEYRDRLPFTVYTISWDFKGVHMKMEGRDLRKMVDMVIATAKAYQ